LDTYIASSRVGANTIAWTLLVPKNFFYLKYSTVGSPKANVLPEPVRSLATKSCLW